MSFTGIWEQYNPHILHWLIVRELVQLEIIRFRAVYLTALFFLLNQMLSLRIISNIPQYINYILIYCGMFSAFCKILLGMCNTCSHIICFLDFRITIDFSAHGYATAE